MTEKKNKKDFSDDDIDLSNDDYDVEVESASEDDSQDLNHFKDKKLSNISSKTIIKEEKKKKMNKKDRNFNQKISDTDEESDDDIGFLKQEEDIYHDDWSSVQHKLDIMTPLELIEDMKYIPNIYKNEMYSGLSDPIKHNIINQQQNNIEFLVSEHKNITSHILQKAERTELIGIRATHLSMGSEPYVDIINETDPIQIAIKELKMKQFPLLLKRQLNSIKSEIKNPNEMTVIWDD